VATSGSGGCWTFPTRLAWPVEILLLEVTY
jgi:hypothetical protein